MFSALLAACVSAEAQQAVRPTPVVGYRMSYSGHIMGVTCEDWKLTEIKPDGSLVSQCGNYMMETASSENDFNPIRLSTLHGVKLIEFTPYAPSIKFPLAVGNTWQSKYRYYSTEFGEPIDTSGSCNVAGYESVRVAAGEFQAFRIECVDEVAAGSRKFKTNTTRWYAPEAAGFVKLDNREDPGRWNFELTSYGMGDAVTTPSAPAAASSAPDGGTVELEAPNLDEMAPILDPESY